MRYAVAIHKDEDSDYGVSVPDLPGCFSAGDTLDNAMSQVVEAIETHIEGLMIDGEPVPAASSIEALRADENYADATWAVVDVDISRLSGKTRRINITMTERLLSRACCRNWTRQRKALAALVPGFWPMLLWNICANTAMEPVADCTDKPIYWR